MTKLMKFNGNAMLRRFFPRLLMLELLISDCYLPEDSDRPTDSFLFHQDYYPLYTEA